MSPTHHGGVTASSEPEDVDHEHSLDRTEAMFAEADDGDVVLDSFFTFACRFFHASALFVVHGGNVAGRDAAGVGLLSRDRVMTFRTMHRPMHELAATIAKEIGCPAEALVLIVPVVVSSRIVAFVVGDGGLHGLDDDESRLLRHAARLAGHAIQRLAGKRPSSASQQPSDVPKRSGCQLLRGEPAHQLLDEPEVPFDLERRIKPRAPLTVEISLGSDSHFFVGITSDLSTGGVFVVTYEPLALGDELELEFSLPASTVHARGRVRWMRQATEEAPPGVGIAFTSMDEPGWREIERFCRIRAPLYYDLDEG